MAGDAGVAGIAVVVAVWLWTLTSGFNLAAALRSDLAWFLAVPLWIAGLTTTYNLRAALSLTQTAKTVARHAAVLLVAYAVVYFNAPRLALPRLLALYFVWEASLLTLAWRLVYVWVFAHAGFRRRALVIGSGAAAECIVRAVEESGVRELMVVGVVSDRPGIASRVGATPVVGAVNDLAHLIDELRVSTLILATSEMAPDLLSMLLNCQEAGYDVVRMATVYERALQRVPVQYLEPDWPFNSYAEAVHTKDASRLAKRLLDIAAGAAGAVIFAVLAPFIGLAVWLDSGRPIFYRQSRVGRAGKTFEILKFRTMVADAETKGQARWAERDDPRITRVGKALRLTRFDELPNFLNILRGEMSLVGPRPERPEFVQELERTIPFYRSRLIARPGLTGWAQINCPYGDSVAAAHLKLEYDLYYLKHRSILLDLYIIARTIGTVLTFRGR